MSRLLPADDFDEAIQNTSTAGDEALGCNPYLAIPYGNM